MMNASCERSNLLGRYGRQMILPIIGTDGQEKIKNAKVLVVGAGGIGSSVAMYLATAGVSLTIMDHDTVDTSNLHR
jgi:molybdopterin/thiamine biosynthesis adenylyltransferase